jgi:peptidoglycan/xylan/chitin deacetylase (PgdA/CDA1 family)
MEEYGRVDEKYLSDEYWERIASGIEKYGPANRILSLEYHGDNYFMYDGAYSMTPEQFEIQMRYLLDNEYHFVTGIELVGFLQGWLTLPARSVILTTDSGEASYKSIPRITTLYKRLELEYGVAPHMNSFIWTLGMAESENPRCANDACWQFFRDALQSGYFSFGNHTQSHSDFRTLTDEEIIKDLETSKQKIFDNLGLTVFGMTWPLEECSKSYETLKSLGVKYAFGGSTRELDRLFTYANDDMAFCLPRLFPPNPNGLSGRPNNKTLPEMLNEAMIEIPLD